MSPRLRAPLASASRPARDRPATAALLVAIVAAAASAAGRAEGPAFDCAKAGDVRACVEESYQTRLVERRTQSRRFVASPAFDRVLERQGITFHVSCPNDSAIPILTIVPSGRALLRRFPVYREGDTNANPTGGSRLLEYELVPGEAGPVLHLDEVVDR